MNKYIKTVLVIALIVGGFIYGQSVGSNKSNNDRLNAKIVGQNFVDQMVNGKFSDAYSELGSTEFKESIKEEEFKKEFSGVKGSLTSRETGSVYIGENNALYLQPVTDLSNGEKGAPAMINIILSKENNKWRVLTPTLQ